MTGKLSFEAGYGSLLIALTHLVYTGQTNISGTRIIKGPHLVSHPYFHCTTFRYLI